MFLERAVCGLKIVSDFKKSNVPREGIKPSTRGFSVPNGHGDDLTTTAINCINKNSLNLGLPSGAIRKLSRGYRTLAGRADGRRAGDFHQVEKGLTILPGLRYSSSHRKGRSKTVIAHNRATTVRIVSTQAERHMISQRS